MQGSLKFLVHCVELNMTVAVMKVTQFYELSCMLDEKSLNLLYTGRRKSCHVVAGVLTLSMTNPIWVAKTRMCLQYDQLKTTTHTASTTQKYSSLGGTLRSIWKQEGIRGYYKVGVSSL